MSLELSPQKGSPGWPGAQSSDLTAGTNLISEEIWQCQGPWGWRRAGIPQEHFPGAQGQQKADVSEWWRLRRVNESRVN